MTVNFVIAFLFSWCYRQLLQDLSKWWQWRAKYSFELLWQTKLNLNPLRITEFHDLTCLQSQLKRRAMTVNFVIAFLFSWCWRQLLQDLWKWWRWWAVYICELLWQTKIYLKTLRITELHDLTVTFMIKPLRIRSLFPGDFLGFKQCMTYMRSMALSSSGVYHSIFVISMASRLKPWSYASISPSKETTFQRS